MALPGVSQTVLDGNLGLQPGSNSQITLWMGCCTGTLTTGLPNTLATYGDIQTMTSALGAGELLEAAGYGMKAGTPPVMVMPMNPGTRGGVGSVTHVGSGALAITVSIAPHVAITITCTTAGTLGTAAFTFQLGSGAISAPVVSNANWSSTGYLVPGTYCTVTFTAGSYVAGGTPDTYTISTLGVVAHPTGAGPASPTFTASPIDFYNVKIRIELGGAVGTSQFTYDLDGGINATYTPSANITSAASYAIPGTGLVLAMTGSATALDTYTFQAAGPQPSSTDLTAALTALETTYLSQATYSQVALVQTPGSAAAWATTVAALETARTTLAPLGVNVDFYAGGPTVNTVLPNAGNITVDSADTDSVVITARAGMSARVVACAGDWQMISPVTGLQFRRNAMWAAAARGSKVSPSQDIGAYADGGIASAVLLFRDENATQGFYAAGITCLRTYTPGGSIFLARGLTAMANTSDYYPLANSRVMNKACGIARTAALQYINAKIPTTTRNGLSGVIAESKAQEIESRVNTAMRSGLVDSSPQDAVAVNCVVTRTNNVFSTGQLILTISVQPYAYAPYIVENIGLQVSAS